MTMKGAQHQITTRFYVGPNGFTSGIKPSEFCTHCYGVSNEVA